jgi:hypothetical protein
MARDMTLFVDDDGSAYHIYSSEENATMHISRLADDYLSPSGDVVRVFEGRHMEAPSICKHDGRYWLIASGCTGWDPNPARAAVANSIFGPWKELGNPCQGDGAETTFHSQSTFIHETDEGFIFMADRWNKESLADSRYIWLPLHFDDDKLSLLYCEEWDLSSLNRPQRELSSAQH